MQSQNGFPVLATNHTTGPLPRLRKWVIPGANRHVYLRDGSVGFLLVHFALWFHETISRLDQGVWDEWGWAVRNVRGSSTVISNHASGTAVDLNATLCLRSCKGVVEHAPGCGGQVCVDLLVRWLDGRRADHPGVGNRFEQRHHPGVDHLQLCAPETSFQDRPIERPRATGGAVDADDDLAHEDASGSASRSIQRPIERLRPDRPFGPA